MIDFDNFIKELKDARVFVHYSQIIEVRTGFKYGEDA